MQVSQNALPEKYSSCLFRIPYMGGRVLWELTNSCNYLCSYCIFSSGPKKPVGELSTQDVYRVLGELKQEQFTHIKFTGGEPFLRKDLVNILAKANSLGFSSDLSTNASAITKTNAQALGEVPLSLVHVSLDGHSKELQEKIRGKNTFERTLQGIENLKKFTSHYLRIGTVLYAGNECEIDKMITFYESLGADEVIFSRMEAIGRMKGDISLNAQKTDDQLEREILKLGKNYDGRIKVSTSLTGKNVDCGKGFCPALEKFLFIDHVGRVSPCTWLVENDSKKKSTLTLEEHSLSEILASDPLRSERARIEGDEKRGILGCPAKREIVRVENENK